MLALEENCIFQALTDSSAVILDSTGLNRNTVTLLYKETAQRIDLDALDKLCKLFKCEVSDLLEFQEDR